MKRIEMLCVKSHHKNENGKICKDINKFIWITIWSRWWVIFKHCSEAPSSKKKYLEFFV